jgi:hypothetical protein
MWCSKAKYNAWNSLCRAFASMAHELRNTKCILHCNKMLQSITLGFISCNPTLIEDVIKGLNQFGINSIKFISNSKSRSDFDFSFEFR